MKLSRREMLQIGTKTATAQAFGILGPIGCSIGRPQPTLIESRTRHPEKFLSTLPRLPVLKALRENDTSQYFNIRVKESTMNILGGRRLRFGGTTASFQAQPLRRERAGVPFLLYIMICQSRS